MNDQSPWLLFISAAFGSIVGGFFTIVGGWLQVEMSIRSQRRERLARMYELILRLTKEAHDLAGTLKALAFDKDVLGDPIDVSSNLSGADKALLNFHGTQVHEALNASKDSEIGLSIENDSRSVTVLESYRSLRSAYSHYVIVEKASELDPGSQPRKEFGMCGERIEQSANELEESIREHLNALLSTPLGRVHEYGLIGFKAIGKRVRWGG